MNKKDIKKLLHHREPYLMVDKVFSITDTNIKTSKTHDGDEAHLKGHFPGAPVVPGAMLQEICTQSAGILLTKNYNPAGDDYNSEVTKGHAIGVLNKVEFAKYLGIVKPDRMIETEVELLEYHESLFKFKAIVKQDNKIKAKLKFNLVNISDEHLY